MAVKLAKKKAPTPYNPLASPYATQGDFNNAVSTTARQQIQPQLDEFGLQGSQARSAHQNRQNEMQGWYQAESDAQRAGADSLSQANQGILNSLQGSGQDVQAGMAAAIRQSQQSADAEAAKIGGTARQIDPNYLTAIGGYVGAGNLGLAGNIASANARASADIGIAGTGAREAASAEQRRYQGVNDALTQQRTSLLGQLPGLEQNARESLSNTELAREGQSFQEGLANKQFGLSARAQTESEKSGARSRSSSRSQDQLAQDQFGETKRATRVSEAQQDEQLGIDAKNAETQRKQVLNTAGTDQATAEAKGKQFDSGLAILSNAWKWTDADKVYAKDADGFQTKDTDAKATRNRVEARMHGKFDDIYRQIVAATGMGPGTAYRVMMAGPNAGWAKEAQKRLAALKQVRMAQSGGTPTEGDLPGGNEGGGSVTPKKKAKKK